MSDPSLPRALGTGHALRGPTASEDLIRLGTLVATVLEAGSRKAERDILDDLCTDFRIDLPALEEAATRGTLSLFRRARAIQRTLGMALAERATTVEVLATAVLRHTQGFVAMLDEIYRCLAAADATVGGNCEAFRLRAAGLDVGIELSPAFFERVRSLVKTLSTIEIGRIDDEKLSRFLGVDGDFYGSWSPGRESQNHTRNLARELTHLPWLRAALQDHRHPARESSAVHTKIEACCSAAETFVTESLRLIRAHVRMLEEEPAERTLDTAAAEDADGEPVDFNTRRGTSERILLRERGLLRGGLRPRTMGLAEADDGWTHVRVDRLFPAPHTEGSAPDCLVVVSRDVEPDFYGTAVGALACLCGLWKAGVRRVPDRDSPLWRLVTDGEPEALASWLDVFEHSLRAASEWLTEDVWTPTGTEEREGIGEVLDDYLRLPLWRQRWLLYEVWLIVVTMAAAARAGWRSELALSREAGSAVGVWTLPKGPAATPCATMSLQRGSGAKAHVWYQGRWRRSGIDMMPDVALTTTQSPPRDLVVVEGKDRYRMLIKGMRGGALIVGQKYSDASAALVTWIVNYCSFSGVDAVDPGANRGSDWRALFLAPEMRPGHVPQEFIDTIGVALQPLVERVTNLAQDSKRQWTLAFVCDTTGSMHHNLESFWGAMREVLITHGGAQAFAAFRAFLFGDHDPAHPEPYLVRQIGPALDVAWVIDQAGREPRTHGGDEPEALEDAIRASRDVALRLGGPLCCVVVTDAPPHTTAECPQKIDFRSEVDGLLGEGSVCIVVSDWLSASAEAAWTGYDRHPRFFRISLARRDEILRLFGLIPTLAV